MVATGAAAKSVLLTNLAIAPSRLQRTRVSPSLEDRMFVYWRRAAMSMMRLKKAVAALRDAMASAATFTTVMPWVTVVTPYMVVPAANDAVLMALAATLTTVMPS